MVLWTGIGLLKYLYQTNIYQFILYIHDSVKRKMCRYMFCHVVLRLNKCCTYSIQSSLILSSSSHGASYLDQRSYLTRLISINLGKDVL
jgi:hypothetical protein